MRQRRALIVDLAQSKTHSCFPSFRGDHAFENNFTNSCEPGFWREAEFFYLRRIHDRLDRGQQNLDHQFGRKILAHHSRPLTLDEKLSEKAFDQIGSPTLDDFEDLRRLL